MITVTNIERVRRGIWLRKHSEKEKSHITNHGARYILGEQSAIDKQHYISSKHVSFPQKMGEKKLLSKASSEPSDYDKHFPLVFSYDSYWKLASKSLRDDLSSTFFHSIY